MGQVASNLPAQNHAATVTDATGCANALDIIPLLDPAPFSHFDFGFDREKRLHHAIV